ncbi:glycosyltransferase family 2 protein [Sulfurihydrogenibium subterraneum]|uniref:glycosyltransferase family 2 protein n=1 Tax=Sulfurihydrogenibium subterraneum TaxID=171121 RepID=UPI00049214EE|nr:glycosyltransferase family 2 protein [Sulfurihydrogenibium subterraneum]
MPEVSVIIPVYNGEKYIKDAINSVLNQTFKDLEIVIVNDASTDNTEKVIFENFEKEIKEKKILYHKNPKNMERSYSRNKGYSLSLGKYIFFLDYDDEWEKEYIAESIKYLADYDIVYSFPRTFIDSYGKIKGKSSKKLLDDVGKVIFSGNIGYPSASGFRRGAFLMYDEEISYREDWELFIRSFLAGLKIKILDNNKVKIREHSNRTSKKNLDMLLNTILIYEKYKDLIPDKYINYMKFHLGDMYLRYGDLFNGWKYILQSFREKNLLTFRNIATLIKRGFRLDKYLSYCSLKRMVL